MPGEGDKNRPIQTSFRYTKWSSFWSAIQEDTGRKQCKIKGKSEFGKHTISTKKWLSEIIPGAVLFSRISVISTVKVFSKNNKTDLARHIGTTFRPMKKSTKWSALFLTKQAKLRSDLTANILPFSSEELNRIIVGWIMLI